MSEEEIIKYTKNIINATYIEATEQDKDGNIIEQGLVNQQVIQGLLDLYNKEKEKNIKLQKRNDRQVKIINKKDKQIDELKQIAHNDFEERCRLTFELQKFLEENNSKNDK